MSPHFPHLITAEHDKTLAAGALPACLPRLSGNTCNSNPHPSGIPTSVEFPNRRERMKLSIIFLDRVSVFFEHAN